MHDHRISVVGGAVEAVIYYIIRCYVVLLLFQLSVCIAEKIARSVRANTVLGYCGSKSVLGNTCMVIWYSTAAAETMSDYHQEAFG